MGVTPLIRNGFSAPALLVCAAIWLFFAGLWMAGLYIARRRYAKYSRVLHHAGVDWPPNRSLA
ncbi:hypothetical protein L1I79_19575 [Strepomyces sp. STD 3.1]|uniref:hypothetical protein n=1 Tax=Streptomyces sp. NPDC058985 TaxID=3346684 RepID=UPI001F29DBBF|nr:hypothetical protein [Streptomyces sp. STD 3.1]